MKTEYTILISKYTIQIQNLTASESVLLDSSVGFATSPSSLDSEWVLDALEIDVLEGLLILSKASPVALLLFNSIVFTGIFGLVVVSFIIQSVCIVSKLDFRKLLNY